MEVVKNWLEPKSICDIQVFLGFANFYRRFIQGFSRIAAPLTSMLKTIGSPDKPAPSRNDGNRPASGKNDSNGEVDEFGDDGVEHAKKSGKLKGQKTSKSQKLAKPKKPSKSKNSPNFGATESGPSFLTPKARLTFNRLRLAFTKAPILWHFDPECHIRVETNALGHAIGAMLS